jgi:elongation factor 2 kinase
MRECYRLKKMPKYSKSSNWETAENYVAKKYIQEVDRDTVFEDVKLQMDSKLWAQEYNRHKPPKKVYN